MEQRKFLVLATTAAAIALFAGGILYEFFRWPDRLAVEARGNPTIGKNVAKIEMVIFEDFKCSHGCAFSKEIFPEIKEKYVDTGIARYTIVPVAFIEGSKPIANAVWEVYRQNPEGFYPFLREVIARCDENLRGGELLEIARSVGGIDMARLEECMQTGCHYVELEEK